MKFKLKFGLLKNILNFMMYKKMNMLFVAKVKNKQQQTQQISQSKIQKQQAILACQLKTILALTLAYF